MKHVVVGIIKRENPLSYLLVSSKKDFGVYTGFYYPPSGHIEEGEDEITALKRELYEELKINLTQASKIADTLGDIENQKTSWYICKADNYNFSINDDELNDAVFLVKRKLKV